VRRIHREGYGTLRVVGIFLLGLLAGAYFLFPDQDWLQLAAMFFGLMIFIFFLQFFRNPSRNTTANDLHVIAPADGKVVVIEEVQENEYVKEKVIQVSIFMSPVNVHVNRSPVDGEVTYYKYHPGKYLVAWHPKSSEENERTSLGIKASNGQTIFLRQIAGALARRIVCYARPGQKIGQGQEFGFIKFGSRVDVFLPLGTEVNVKLGDRTRGGESVLATLISS
jgi:phosphatidylserine decarboxylase